MHFIIKINVFLITVVYFKYLIIGQRWAEGAHLSDPKDNRSFLQCPPYRWSMVIYDSELDRLQTAGCCWTKQTDSGQIWSMAVI